MISLKNVSFSYNKETDNKELTNINLKIAKGECVVLCGESGSGKTTLTRLINGLIPHYYDGILEGTVTIGSKNISKLPLYKIAETVGSVFQNPRSQFFNTETTGELAFGCENLGIDVEETKRRISKSVKEFSIAHLMDRSIFGLSGGEKQKLACASISTLCPDVIVLDEPSSNLDMVGIEHLRKVIDIWKKQGKTIIVSEHRLYYLKNIADRLIYFDNGNIVKEFTPEELETSQKSGDETSLRPLDLSLINKPVNDYSKNSTVSISIKDFKFGYNRVTKTLNIDKFTIPQNQIIAIIGDNGSGKSTFAKCLCGLIKNKGTINYNGSNKNWKSRLNKCFMVMQDVNHQLFTESVLDEVLLSMENENIELAKKTLADFNLGDYSNRHPISLSGGQKQRVAIASAVISSRDIILFDEPTSGLDLKHMKKVADNLKNLLDKDKTLLIISHDLEFITSCCSYVIKIEDGNIADSYQLTQSSYPKLLEYFTKI